MTMTRKGIGIAHASLSETSVSRITREAGPDQACLVWGGQARDYEIACWIIM
jgi:hypothetical protein